MSKTIATRHFLIYKTTNTINGKIYIGKHITKNIDDGYMGSGKHLKRAINKYGIENFSREILYLCKTEEEMNDKEAELVTEEFCLREDTYNLCVGGKGGFSYINRNELQGFKLYKSLSRENRKKANEKGALEKSLEKRKELSNNNSDYYQSINIKIKNTKERNGTWRKGTAPSDITKRKMRSANKKSTAVEINGKKYDSIKQAADEMKTHTSVLIRKLKSDSFIAYKYI